MNLVTIPHGIAIDDSWVQKVEVREINGYDEQLLTEIRDYPIPFKTTALLGRVIGFGE